MSTRPRAEIRAIHVHGGETSTARPDADADALNEVLRRVGSAHRIEMLCVERDAKLRAMPSLADLPHLACLDASSSSVRDWSAVGRPTSLRVLSLRSFSESDLSRFDDCALDDLFVVSRSVKTLRLTARDAFFLNCGPLADVAGARIESLDLCRPRHLDLSTLARVVGLRRLTLRARPALRDLSFLDGCSSLEHLTLAAIPRLAQLDLSALDRVRRLRSVYLDVRNSVVARVAQACPRMIVTNGIVCFDRGRQTTTQAYYALDVDDA